MYLSSLLPQITSPNHLGTKSKTRIDNIFSTDSPEEFISGNMLTSICGHLAQFAIHKTKDRKKKKTYKKSFKLFFHIFENLLDTYAPLKRFSNSDLELLSKPWITHGIMTSINIKDKIYKKLLKSKNSEQKERLYNEFKRYRNRINILPRNSEANLYQNLFQDHKQNMLKTLEGIKYIININTSKNKSIVSMYIIPKKRTPLL